MNYVTQSSQFIANSHKVLDIIFKCGPNEHFASLRLAELV